MKTESENYNRVLNLLRRSEPILDSSENIEKEVIKSITKNNRTGLVLSEVFDFLFSWVYIGWVRRSLIAASIILVLVFVFQQGIILKRIDVLSRQTVVVEKENASSSVDELQKMIMVYRNSGIRLPSKSITISESQMKELLESLKELQGKYKDLENLLNEDPELKKLIEKKLIEYNHTKTNL
jgi:CHASE3 domain sensor protein